MGTYGNGGWKIALISRHLLFEGRRVKRAKRSSVRPATQATGKAGNTAASAAAPCLRSTSFARWQFFWQHPSSSLVSKGVWHAEREGGTRGRRSSSCLFLPTPQNTNWVGFGYVRTQLNAHGAMASPLLLLPPKKMQVSQATIIIIVRG